MRMHVFRSEEHFLEVETSLKNHFQFKWIHQQKSSPKESIYFSGFPWVLIYEENQDGLVTLARLKTVFYMILKLGFNGKYLIFLNLNTIEMFLRWCWIDCSNKNRGVRKCISASHLTYLNAILRFTSKQDLLVVISIDGTRFRGFRYIHDETPHCNLQTSDVLFTFSFFTKRWTFAYFWVLYPLLSLK